MSAKLYYFTGTGNSLSIAKTIAQGLPDSELVSIPGNSTMEKIMPQADVVGIIYPTYFMDAPVPVMQFLTNLEINPGTYVFLYSNCGATLGNALGNPYSLLQKKGISVNAAFWTTLPDNSIIFPTPLEDQARLLKEHEVQIKDHLKIIQSNGYTPSPKTSVPGALACSAMKLANKLYFGMDQIKIDGTKCNNCGICTKVCSSNNLLQGTNSPHVGDQCSMCFSCIHYCSQEAIQFKRMKITPNYQYHNPSITVKEMIEVRAGIH